MEASSHDRRRWFALTALCLGIVMIVIDGSVVAVAIPSIRTDLGFGETSLVWLVNAYALTFGGFQLFSGRLGDLYGTRKLFLIGIAGFTITSLACGLANSQAWLIWSRAAQGLAASAVDAVGLALIINTFTEPEERAKAMGICAFAGCASGSIGVFLGGIITISLSWHWIFLINVPVGLIVYVACIWFIPSSAGTGNSPSEPLDVLGAVLVTTSLVLAVYAFINGNEAGWVSARTVGTLAGAATLMLAFVVIERRVRAPLVPLSLFRSRPLLIANVAAALWTGATFGWGFICTLYMQRVLGHDAMQVALAFVPANVAAGILALWFSAKIVARFGIKAPMTTGLFLGALGLALFAAAPVDGTILTNVLPGMALLGIASGISFNPMLLAAVNGVESKDSGVAAGLIGTSSMMGGALGLAVLASAADAWTGMLSMSGVLPLLALNSGYHLSFAIGAMLAATAAVLAFALLPPESADKLPPRAPNFLG